MNVEAELQNINFAAFSRIKDELLRKLLQERKLRRGMDTELDLEALDSVSAAKNFIKEEHLK